MRRFYEHRSIGQGHQGRDIRGIGHQGSEPAKESLAATQPAKNTNNRNFYLLTKVSRFKNYIFPLFCNIWVSDLLV